MDLFCLKDEGLDFVKFSLDDIDYNFVRWDWSCRTSFPPLEDIHDDAISCFPSCLVLHRVLFVVLLLLL